MSDAAKAATPPEDRLLHDESLAQFVLRFLLEGRLRVRVTLPDRIFEGYVHNLDYAKGSDHVFASVAPEDREDDTMVRVAIHLDGTITVLPDEEGLVPIGHRQDAAGAST